MSNSPEKELKKEKSEDVESNEKVLENEDKKDKFMRLLGGKKNKNQSDAGQWMSKLRNSEDEQKLAQGLESQFNHSLDHKLTGKARRKQGFGFEDKQTVTPSGENQERSRERSRSPINKNREETEQKCENENKPTISSSRENAKKKFLMQFQKASS